MSHFEPGACLSLWPTEQCEWSTWDIWRSSDVVEHVIYVFLAFMLGYTFFVLIRFSLRHHSARHELRHVGISLGDANLRSRRRLAVHFGSGLGTLKAIGSGAPFLGLAGTCYGIMGGAFMGFNMEKHAAMRMLTMNIASSLSTAAAGIVAAIPATLSHNFIRTRIEVLRAECPVRNVISDEFSIRTRSIRFAQTLPLRDRLSNPPPFAVLATTVLSCVVAMFIAFEPYVPPTGLRVLLPSFPCRVEVSSRIIVLQITKSGELFINQEPISRTDLPRRLAAIYSARARRELYVRADDGASFQMVVDAMDTATTIRRPEFSSLDLNVFLITPQAEAESDECFKLVMDRIRQRAAKTPK